MSVTQPTTTALANWFGTDRMLCDRIGAELAGCDWVGVPFAGGMGVLRTIGCNYGVASDLHRHVINLARVVSDREQRAELIERLGFLPLHDAVLKEAQGRLVARELIVPVDTDRPDSLVNAALLMMPPHEGIARNLLGDVEWAADYYIASFMGRAGASGTKTELKGGISVRWKHGGGGSSQRWVSAVNSLDAWGEILPRWTFLTMDAFRLLDKVAERDNDGVKLKSGVYCDPPFPKVGDAYRHRFPAGAHRELAKRLGALTQTRVVLRYHDHPLVRELYADEQKWTITCPPGRTQTNAAAAELLILNGPSRVAEVAA